MAIAPKPNRKQTATVKADDAAEAFIQGAGQPEPAAPAPKKAKKEPVLMRFDDGILARIDRQASRLGLSRAAWVRMVVAERLEGDE